MVLSGWKSQYCYTLTPASCPSSSSFRFGVEWSRRPSPHEPLPSIRVHMTAAVSALDGEITCRLEGEDALHRCSADINGTLDAHILRLLKAKAEFIKRASLPLHAQHAAFLSSRLQYTTYSPPAISALGTHSSAQHKLVAALDRRHTTALSRAEMQRSNRAQHTTRRRGWEEEEEGQCWEEEEQERHVNDGEPQRADSVGVEAASDAAAAAGQETVTASSGAESVGSEWPGEVSARVLASKSVPSSSEARLSSSSFAAAPLSAYSLPSAAALEGRLVELFRQADVDGRYATHLSTPHRTTALAPALSRPVRVWCVCSWL